MVKTSSTKKGFLRTYVDSLSVIPFFFVLVVYPNVVMHRNPPPKEGETKVMSGVIVRAQRQHSNILLKLPDDTVQALDFPGSLQGVYAAMWPHFTKAHPEDLHRLQGCKTEVHVDHLHGLIIPSNPRIWSLRCDRYSITHEEMVAYYHDVSNDLAAVLIIWVGSIALWLAVIAKEFSNRNK